MITLFEKLARQSIAALQNVDPYVMSHPMPMDRIRNLEEAAKKSPYYDAKDPPALCCATSWCRRSSLGFTGGAQAVMQRYPSTDQSMPARYARAIALFRKGDIKNALPVMESLTAELPENPYFWELKGQALLENGRAAEAVAPLQKALKLLPNNGLIQIMMAQALIDTEKPRQCREGDQAAEAGPALRGRDAGDLQVPGPRLCADRRHPARRTGHRRGGPPAGRPQARASRRRSRPRSCSRRARRNGPALTMF